MNQYFILLPNLSPPESSISPVMASPIQVSIDRTSPFSSSISLEVEFVSSPKTHPGSDSAPALCKNIHPMQTRSKTTAHQHQIHPSLLLSHSKPKTVNQALSDANWTTTMQCKYEALLKQKTWDLVSLPPGRKMISCKWVFRVKENANDSINKYKACLIAKGFHLIHGFDFHETFSSVIELVTIRVILTVVVSHRWKLFHLDVNNAFLNRILDEIVYMQQPPGFEASDKSLVCKLNKAFYGLKQAPRQWFTRLQHTL